MFFNLRVSSCLVRCVIFPPLLSSGCFIVSLLQFGLGGVFPFHGCPSKQRGAVSAALPQVLLRRSSFAALFIPLSWLFLTGCPIQNAKIHKTKQKSHPRLPFQDGSFSLGAPPPPGPPGPKKRRERGERAPRAFRDAPTRLVEGPEGLRQLLESRRLVESEGANGHPWVNCRCSFCRIFHVFFGGPILFSFFFFFGGGGNTDPTNPVLFCSVLFVVCYFCRCSPLFSFFFFWGGEEPSHFSWMRKTPALFFFGGGGTPSLKKTKTKRT